MDNIPVLSEWIKTITSKVSASEKIVIVSGLPRSGTSMMMQMLTAGGLMPMTDHQRTPDANNPKGYYELERVKALPEGDTAWLEDSQGKVVKIVSALLQHLPDTYRYQIIFMRRDTEEIVQSQMNMLERLKRKAEREQSREQLFDSYKSHLSEVIQWIDAQSHIETLYVNHRNVLYYTQPWAREISTFLDADLDQAAMVGTVDVSLYRERKTASST